MWQRHLHQLYVGQGRSVTAPRLGLSASAPPPFSHLLGIIFPVRWSWRPHSRRRSHRLCVTQRCVLCIRNYHFLDMLMLVRTSVSRQRERKKTKRAQWLRDPYSFETGAIPPAYTYTPLMPLRRKYKTSHPSRDSRKRRKLMSDRRCLSGCVGVECWSYKRALLCTNEPRKPRARALSRGQRPAAPAR